MGETEKNHLICSGNAFILVWTEYLAPKGDSTPTQTWLLRGNSKQNV